MPFQSKMNNFLEITNETTFLVLTYMLYLFTDYTDYDKNILGWVFIGILVMNAIINVSVIMFA